MRGSRLAELRAEAAEQRLAEMQQGLGGSEDMTQHIEVRTVSCLRQCGPANTLWSVTSCCLHLLWRLRLLDAGAEASQLMD